MGLSDGEAYGLPLLRTLAAGFHSFGSLLPVQLQRGTEYAIPIFVADPLGYEPGSEAVNAPKVPGKVDRSAQILSNFAVSQQD